MPRTARLILPQSYYHIMTRGNNKNKVFRVEDDYFYYLELLRKYKAELPFDLYHYCLMPNHVHMLVKTHKETDFSLLMKKINLAFFHHYRKIYGWSGHFWQDRFKSQPVGKDKYFIQCGKYIELNPVRAKLVSKPEDYPFSSNRFYSEGKTNDLITDDFFYNDLDADHVKRQTKYQEMVIGDIIIENYKRPVWGSIRQRYNESKKARYHGKYIV